MLLRNTISVISSLLLYTSTISAHLPTYNVHHNWHKLSASPLTDTVIRLDIAIKQNSTGLQQLANIVEQISDPTNILYGSWLTLDEIGSYTSPSSDAINSITNWFNSYNALSIDYTINHDFATVYMLASDAMTAFTGYNGTQQGYGYHVYQHKQNHNIKLNRINMNTYELTSVMNNNSDYSTIAKYIDLIQGLNDYPDLFPASNTTALINSSSPDIFPSGSQNTLSVEIILYCQNGATSSNPNITSAPCSELNQPGINAVNLTVTPQGYEPQHYYYSIHDSSTWSSVYQGNGLIVTPYYHIPDWVLVNITAVSTYTDGSTSVLGGFPNDGTFKLYAPTIYSTVIDISEYYGVPRGYRATNGSQAIFEAEFQYIYPNDTVSYFQQIGIVPPEIIYKNDNAYETAVGGFIAGAYGAGGESTGDLQMIAGIATVPTTVWQVSGPLGEKYDGYNLTDPYPGPASLQGTVPAQQGMDTPCI